jgi:hypothetical protein
VKNTYGGLPKFYTMWEHSNVAQGKYLKGKKQNLCMKREGDWGGGGVVLRNLEYFWAASQRMENDVFEMLREVEDFEGVGGVDVN